MPTRRSSRPPETAAAVKSTGSHLWVLRDGRLESIPVRLGLSDGRNTEVSGDALTEGLIVVLRANPPAQ